SEPGGGSFNSMWDMYFPLSTSWDILLVVLSVAGFVGSWVRRRHLGIWMGVYIVVLMVGVKVAQGGLPVIGLLWNPRILPFLYLLRYMLAAIGVYEVVSYVRRVIAIERASGDITATPNTRVSTSILWAVTLFCLVVIGVRYQSLPFAKITSTATATKYSWGPIDFPASRAFSDGWARWNFEGYEGKASYGEYHNLVQTMKSLGDDKDHGCGRALWENNSELNKYGTTMALMLLPFWTKGCIGSMEGLYFEAAGTTPYHFISAAALSKQSSNPVRELRYDNNDPVKGVKYMQMLGIKYYMAFTPEAVQKADTVADLVKVGTSGPWHIYELEELPMVEALDVQPVVINERPGDRRERWLEIGTSYFQHSEEWNALPVSDGPKEWQRIDVKPDESRQVGKEGEPGRQVDVVVPSTAIKTQPVDVATISNVQIKDEEVSFTVDKIGTPVLVKVSYFPNWTVTGAKEIYRAAPNMMVVVPSEKNVRLSYEPSRLDQFSYLLTFAGIVLVAYMFSRRLRYGSALPERNSQEDHVESSVSDGDTDSLSR
ncbi:MAG: hypothetical protein ACO3JF_07910, partial [Ilumatobacteraceae bacterium]